MFAFKKPTSNNVELITKYILCKYLQNTKDTTILKQYCFKSTIHRTVNALLKHDWVPHLNLISFITSACLKMRKKSRDDIKLSPSFPLIITTIYKNTCQGFQF